MSQKTCLLLKPHVTDPNDSVRQQRELKNINGALKQTNLQLLEGEAGLEVKDISERVVQRVYEADVVVVDANLYQSSSECQPFLYYLLAWSHCQWDKTILVARSTSHLPLNLRMSSYTLAYEGDVWEFIDKFGWTVREILSGSSKRANNPLQDFIQAMQRAASQAEQARLKAELEAKEAEIRRIKEQEIAQLKAQLQEKDRQLNQVKQQPREATEPERIQFQRVTRAR